MKNNINKRTLLYVEDDETLSYLTKDNLEMKGYNVLHAETGEEALKLFKENHVDLCIIDIMLPKVDGYTVASEIRSKDQEIPILFLSAKSMVEDRLKGLRLGADDYMTKPFSIEELDLKINVFLRRSNRSVEVEQSEYKVGNTFFDYYKLKLVCGESEISMTQREAELLKFFLDNRDKVLRREDILKTVWGDDNYFLGRSLDVFISRLRKMLKKDPKIHLENIHGIGFRFRFG